MCEVGHVALYVQNCVMWLCVNVCVCVQPAQLHCAGIHSAIIKPVALSHLQTLASATSGVVVAGSVMQRQTEGNRYEKQRWRNADITEQPLLVLSA